MGLVVSIICLAITVIAIPLKMVGVLTCPWWVPFSPLLIIAGMGAHSIGIFIAMLWAEKKNLPR